MLLETQLLWRLQLWLHPEINSIHFIYEYQYHYLFTDDFFEDMVGRHDVFLPYSKSSTSTSVFYVNVANRVRLSIQKRFQIPWLYHGVTWFPEIGIVFCV